MTTGSSSLVKKILFFPAQMFKFVADPANLACSAGHSSELAGGPQFSVLLSVTVWVHQCEVVFGFSCETISSNHLFQASCAAPPQRQGSWKLVIKGFSSQVSTVWVHQCEASCAAPPQRQGSWKFPPTSTQESLKSG